MLNELNELTDRFKIVKLVITVQLNADTLLPPFKGAMWHGLFGHVLMNYDQTLYHVFYGEHAEQQPKPYSIAPEADYKTHWRKHELLSFSLTLFGEACMSSEQIIEAWRSAEKNKALGLGEQVAPFRLLSVCSKTPMGITPGIVCLKLSDWLSSLDLSWPRSEFALHFNTPLRLKHNGKIQRILPNEASVYLSLATRRLIQLSQFWVCDDTPLFETLEWQTKKYSELHIEVNVNGYFEDWQRYSQRHNKLIPISGFKGQISLSCGDPNLIVLFKIAELLQLGGKTTFGLGQFQLIA